MNKISLFVDGSFVVLSRTGFGACLVVSAPIPSPETLKRQVKVKRLEQTPSTKLELQTLLWALNEIPLVIHNCDLFVYFFTESFFFVSKVSFY